MEYPREEHYKFKDGKDKTKEAISFVLPNEVGVERVVAQEETTEGKKVEIRCTKVTESTESSHGDAVQKYTIFDDKEKPEWDK